MIEKEPEQMLYERIEIDDDLELRAIKTDEADKLFELTDANREYLGKYLPWVKKTNSPDDSLAFIKSVQSHRSNGEEYGFGIILLGEVVGHISLMHLKDDKEPEIGYWIAQPASGKGVTTKAARTLTDFGLNELGQEKILIRARVDNTVSNRIPKTLGFTFDGIHEDDDGEKLNHWVKEA